MGRLIAIEANDGAGKATQTQLVTEFLISRGFNVKNVSFPKYDNISSTPVKMYLNGEISNNADEISAYQASVLFACDRFLSFKNEWHRDFDEADFIISDRYTTSNMTHQAQKIKDLNQIKEFLKWIKHFEYEIMGIPKPELVIYLDILPEISLEAIKNRKNKIDNSDIKDIHERDINHIKNSYEISKQVLQFEGWTSVKCYDGNSFRDKYEIRDEIIEIIRKNMIYGNKKNIENLTWILENGDLSHAYGFVGMRGIGKATFAKFLAKNILYRYDISHINKHNMPKDIDVKQAYQSNIRDLLIIESIDNKILANQIEQIEEFFSIKSQGTKIAIIDDFDCIDEILQNKLLKLIEEPPTKSVIFLIIENKYKVLPTILSRLNVINFNPLTTYDIANISKELDTQYNHAYAKLSLGSMKYYFSWFDNDFHDDVFNFVDNYLELIFLGQNNGEILTFFKKYKLDMDYIFDLMIKIKHDIIHIKQGVECKAHSLVSLDLSEFSNLNVIDVLNRFEFLQTHMDIIQKVSIGNILEGMSAITECRKRTNNSQNEILINQKLIFELIRSSYDRCGRSKT